MGRERAEVGRERAEVDRGRGRRWAGGEGGGADLGLLDLLGLAPHLCLLGLAPPHLHLYG